MLDMIAQKRGSREYGGGGRTTSGFEGVGAECQDVGGEAGLEECGLVGRDGGG